jgi:4-amino-4-deoxy-L-arabinose transferase-like glycosyltransferase
MEMTLQQPVASLVHMPFFRSRQFLIAILILISALILLSNLGLRDLWDPDETRYAVIAREMRVSGDWILPHFNGRIYAEKPPLFFWLVNLSTSLFGQQSEVAHRLPSALAALITIYVTFVFGERLFNTRVGLVSGLMLATCVLFPQVSRWVILDSVFTLFLVLTVFYLHKGFEGSEGRRKAYLCAGLFMGLGVLTKGPVAYLSLLVFFAYGLLLKDVRRFWNKDLLWGFFLSVAIALAWLIPACMKGGEDYTRTVLIWQTLGRLKGTGASTHPEPFFFYFLWFPAEFLPWSVLLPAAFVLTFRSKGIERKRFLFLLIWLVIPICFLTLSKGKKDTYLLPFYSAAALMVGSLWASEAPSPGIRKGMMAGGIFMTSAILVALVLTLLGLPDRFDPRLHDYRSTGIIISSYLFMGSFLSTLFFIKKWRWASLMSGVIVCLFLHFHLSYFLPREFNAKRSLKPFSELILHTMREGDELKTSYFTPPGLLFYTRKNYVEDIRSGKRLSEVMKLSQRVFVVIQKVDLEQINSKNPLEFYVIHETKAGPWTMVLLSNRPGETTSMAP